MGRPTQNDVRVDPVLTNMSVAYTNDELVADQIMPIVQVKKITGKYYEYDKDNFRIMDSERAPGSRANVTEHGLTLRSYGPIIEHALEEEVPTEVIDQAEDVLSPLQDAAENVMDKLLLGKEKELATIMATSGNFTNSVTLSGTDQWSDFANSDPLDDVETGRTAIHQATFKRANALVLPYKVYRKLAHHPQLKAELSVNRNKTLDTADLADLFEVEEVIIAASGENAVDEGQTSALTYVWGNHAWLIFRAKQPKLKQLTFGWTLKVRGGIKTDRRFSEDEIQHIVRTRDTREHKIVADVCAYPIYNAIA